MGNTLQTRPHVAVLTETTHAAGRNILRGIALYVREHESWSVYYAPRALGDKAASWLKNWDGNGMIVRISSEAAMEEIRQYGKPMINMIGGQPADPECPQVLVSDEEIGRRAAEYFIKNGFDRFAFLGMKNEVWSLGRKIGFFNALTEHGHSMQTLELPSFYESDYEQSWETLEEQVAAWAEGLPRPCAVFCANDDLGCHLIEACRRAAIRVPDELALLGADNDILFCELCAPPLSSIDANHFLAGYQAAAMLDRLMRGETPDSARLYVPPGEIVVRQSSNILAVDDRNLVDAVRFIEEHACENITVDTVAGHAFLSRSVLQRRFKAAFGQTVHERILQERIKLARRLLVGTTLSVAEVAEKSGFTHQEYMGVVFRRHLKTSPAQYRKKFQKN
ncbi:MAG: DNA-binding transcriptional regulator [Kiritimatiellales bacterium]|nr:DNA-binding transcriptional regulator [Kiritimatiellales bacterium]